MRNCAGVNVSLDKTLSVSCLVTEAKLLSISADSYFLIRSIKLISWVLYALIFGVRFQVIGYHLNIKHLSTGDTVPIENKTPLPIGLETAH